MNWLIGTAIALAAVVVAAVIAGQAGLLRGNPPADLGVRDGRLKRPSLTPNSVSSQADLHADHPMREYARIPALSAGASGPEAIRRVRALVQRMPGATVIEERDDYLYAQFETRTLRFVDDVEFWYDAATQQLHVRSGSRIGRKDFGVNRARIEAIRVQLLP